MRSFVLSALLLLVVGLELAAWLLGRRPTQARLAPGRHVLVYDGDCGLCTGAAWLVARRTTAQLDLVPFAELPRDGLLEALDGDEVRASAHYVTPEGLEYHGGEAVTRVSRLLPGLALLRVLDWPLLRGFREIGYRLVATQRARVSRLLGAG